MNETVPSEASVQATEVTELVTTPTESPTTETDNGAVEVEAITVVDYSPVIYEVGNGLATTIIWCSFLIVGVLIAFKILEVKR